MGVSFPLVPLCMPLSRYEILARNLNSASRYELLHGRDRKSGKAVTINTWPLDSALSKTLYENELAVHHRLSHTQCDSICPILKIFQSESSAFVVMEQKTMTLQEFVTASCPNGMPKKMIPTVFRQVCEAVQTLHKQGIAHLDLHPENIYLSPDLQAFLGHLGCAFVSSPRKRRASKRQAEPMLGRRGSLSYSSVEMFESPESYDPYRSDMYSLGALLHYMSTGAAPHITRHVVDCSPERDLEGYISRFPSNAIYELVELLVSADPSARPSLKYVLEHPVLTTNRRRSHSLSLPFRGVSQTIKASAKSGWKNRSWQSIRERAAL